MNAIINICIKKLDSNAQLPKYEHSDDAGMDVYANETKTLQPGERGLISTGIALAIPLGYVGLIWDKSGIATKYGISTLAGVIDAGYRGEIKIALLNTSQDSYTIETGKKIAQCLIQPIHQAQLIEVPELPASQRGDGGFGSTGL